MKSVLNYGRMVCVITALMSRRKTGNIVILINFRNTLGHVINFRNTLRNTLEIFNNNFSEYPSEHPRTLNQFSEYPSEHLVFLMAIFGIPFGTPSY